jgi:hypothetical protein
MEVLIMDTSAIDLTKISQRGLVVGDINAPITVIEFINLRCPYSKTWFKKAAPILEPAVASGRIKRVFKLFDKPKVTLRKGNLAQHHLPYDQPEQAYAAIKILFAQQTEWGEQLNDTQIEAYIKQHFGFKLQPNQAMIDLVLNEAAAANIQFVPTVIIGEAIFDEHPYCQDIPSQRSSDLFQSIDEEGRMAFFQKQGNRRMEKEYWAFDTTSISSYSEVLSQVKKGRNKEHDRLPQINLALLFGAQSGLPFYYRKLSGNITDVKTVRQLMKEFDVMGYKKVNVIFDRGFYSKDNINALYKHHQKFVIGVQLKLKYVKGVLEQERENLKLWSNFETQFNTYGVCRTINWEYEQERPYKGDVIKSEKRAYLHLFYNPEKAIKDQVDMNDYLTALHQDLKENTLKDYRMKDYDKYFEVTETPKRGKKITPKEDAMRNAVRNYGYFALLSNEVIDPFEALSLYRSKDVVEKAFGNLKERLNFRRMQVSSELSLNGKLFVEFIALIYLSYVKKKMQDAELFNQWTLQGVLDELDTIELFESPGHGRLLGEVTTKQKELYEALGVAPPSL